MPAALTANGRIVNLVLRGEDSMGATESVGFIAKVQQNLGVVFVTKQHKSLHKLHAVHSLVQVTC